MVTTLSVATFPEEREAKRQALLDAVESLRGVILAGSDEAEETGTLPQTTVDAIHEAGLVSLTHTPSPMGFLNEILGRPENERPFLILVVGHPAPDATVPELHRKSLEEIAIFIE